jgi:hypothetical protein
VFHPVLLVASRHEDLCHLIVAQCHPATLARMVLANRGHKVAEVVQLLWKAGLILLDVVPPYCRSAKGVDSAGLGQVQGDSLLEQAEELTLEEAYKARS